jgi:hypothetical protein
MTLEEVKEAVESALQAIREYKIQNRTKTANARPSLTESLEKEDLEKSVKELIKEAYEVGMAGELCKRCHGTGREP